MEVFKTENSQPIGNSSLIRGILGMDSTEQLITMPQKTLIAGKWFDENDKYSCLLPARLATNLNISISDVGQTTVSISGTEFLVIGIFSETEFDRISDLNGENDTLTPANFVYFRPPTTSRFKEYLTSQALVEEYFYMPSSSVAIIPFDVLIESDGTYRSIAAIRKDNAPAKDIEEDISGIMKSRSIMLYAGLNGKPYLFSSISANAFSGLGNLAIPLGIAALIILNSMLGSVYERQREIWTYNSVGLSPMHISALFVAESCVFAVIGSVAGYLVGQTIAKMVTSETMSLFGITYKNFMHLPGLTLNYSSTSAVAAVFLVMATTIASTIYPAKKAHELAMPDIEMSWQMQQTKSGAWIMNLPFVVQKSVIKAINSYK